MWTRPFSLLHGVNGTHLGANHVDVGVAERANVSPNQLVRQTVGPLGWQPLGLGLGFEVTHPVRVPLAANLA